MNKTVFFLMTHLEAGSSFVTVVEVFEEYLSNMNDCFLIKPSGEKRREKNGCLQRIVLLKPEH